MTTIITINCTQCGIEVQKEPNQLKEYRNPFCGSSCAATYNNNLARSPKRKKEGIYRECLNPNCSEVFYVISSLKDLKKYCNNKCQGTYEWEIQKQAVLEHGVETLGFAGEYRHQTYDRILKRLIIEEYPHGKSGAACWLCEWETMNPFTNKIPTQLNHIDGNPLNNTISNLEIVCPNCHSLGEFFGSRGKGGRTRASKR